MDYTYTYRLFFGSIMPHPFIVLGIDIDDTIISSKVRNRIQFIGDKRAWIGAIKELRQYCQERGVTLIPQLITAKSDGNTDSTVDAIMGQMKEVFTPLDSNGQSRELRSPHQYIVTRHISSGKIMNAFNNLDASVRHPRDTSVAPLPLQAEERTTISPVHVVQGNYNGQTSKAHVLQHISTFFGGVDQDNVFLIDDADYNEDNLRDRCGDSSVGQYKFIQAGHPGVIEEFVRAVKKRADEIATLRVEVEAEQVEQLEVRTNVAEGVNVVSLKAAVSGYLDHLHEKLKSHSVQLDHNNKPILPDDSSPYIKKLVTRYNTIFDLHSTIKDKPILEIADLTSAKNAVNCCANNKPEWSERPFLQKLTDRLSLGLKVIYRAFFSKEADFQDTIEQAATIPQTGMK